MDHFRFMAPIYDLALGRPGLDWWRQVLRLPVDGWVLDAGGGTGRVSAILPESSGGVAVCDVSRPMLARTKYKKSICPVLAPAERLPFPAGVFDRAIVVDALHHFNNQEQAVKELARVLKPGGRLVVEEPDIRLAAIKVVSLLERLSFMGSRFYDSDAIEAMMKAAGLSPRIERRAELRVWISGVKR